MNDVVVDVKYDDIEAEIESVNVLLEELKTEVVELVATALESGAWKSKYQRAYDRHIKNNTQKYIKSVITSCEKYNKYLKKTVGNYKKIDVFR